MVDADLNEVGIITKRLRRIRESGPLHHYCTYSRNAILLASTAINSVLRQHDRKGVQPNYWICRPRKLKKGAISSLRVDWYGRLLLSRKLFPICPAIS